MRIGIDLDNTIIDYDRAFADAALAIGVTGGGKTAIRDRIRALPDGERRWQAIQADVYGPRIGTARLFAGVPQFFERAAATGIDLAIVSHKSTYAAARPDGPNLRDCALAFVRERGITVPVYFESTRVEKCRRIAALDCACFIDDLVEVFADPAFPAPVARWLFAPHGAPAEVRADRVFADWAALAATLG